MGYPVYGAGSTVTPGTNFAFAIVLFVLLIIAGLGLFYLLRTLVWSGA